MPSRAWEWPPGGFCRVRLPACWLGPCAALRSGVELADQLGDALLDVVARRADFVHRPSLRVGQVPVDVALAGDVRALVAAPHRHDRVRPLGELAGERARLAAHEVDA